MKVREEVQKNQRLKDDILEQTQWLIWRQMEIENERSRGGDSVSCRVAEFFSQELPQLLLTIDSIILSLNLLRSFFLSFFLSYFLSFFLSFFLSLSSSSFPSCHTFTLLSFLLHLFRCLPVPLLPHLPHFGPCLPRSIATLLPWICISGEKCKSRFSVNSGGKS